MVRRKWNVAMLLLAMLALSACRPIQAPAEPVANKVLMNQLAEAWSTGAPELIDKALKPEFVLHQVEFPGIASAHDYWLFIYDVHSFAPDFKATFSDVLADGDWVIARGLLEATPPSDGRHARYGALHMARVADGQIAELWTVTDEIAVNKYFGEIPNPGDRADFSWGDDGAMPGVTGTREENMALVRQWLEGDDAARQALASEQFMFHSTMYPEQHAFQDRTAIMEELRTAFPDLTITVEEPMIAEGDKVGVRFTMQGANTGPFLDREASGKTFTWPGMAVYRILDGTIVEEWILWSGYYVYSEIRGW